MAKTLTATDRSALIRLASTMDKGSDERKAILAGLKVARTNWKTVNLSPSTLAKATAVNWWYTMKSNMFGEYIAIRVPSEPDMWALTRGERFDPRKFRNVSSAELLRLWQKVGGWVPSDQGGTPHDPSGEKPSHEALHATGDGEALISTDALPDYRQWRNV